VLATTAQTKRPFLLPAKRGWLLASVWLLAVVFAVVASSGGWKPNGVGLPQVPANTGSTDLVLTREDLGKLPLTFIANEGQFDPAVRFRVKYAGHIIFFTPGEVIFSASQQADDDSVTSSVVRLRFRGANHIPTIEGEEQLPSVANFLLGNDSTQWYTNVPTYGAVAYRGLYPGIDLVYRGTEGHLKSEFVVAPSADPRIIRLMYDGVKAVSLQEDGALVLQTELGTLKESVPVVYQEINGRRVAVEGSYLLLGDRQIGFEIGSYNRAYPLVIDPVLSYSTYLGGSSLDRGFGIAVDAAGNTYVTGLTFSTDFPTTTEALQVPFGGGQDAFVTKLTPDGSTIVYSTYLG